MPCWTSCTRGPRAATCPSTYDEPPVQRWLELKACATRSSRRSAHAASTSQRSPFLDSRNGGHVSRLPSPMHLSRCQRHSPPGTPALTPSHGTPPAHLVAYDDPSAWCVGASWTRTSSRAYCFSLLHYSYIYRPTCSSRPTRRRLRRRHGRRNASIDLLYSDIRCSYVLCLDARS